MNINYKQVQAFLRMLVQPQDEESDCEQCLNQLAEFTETTLSGQPVPRALLCTDEHLKRCADCSEEFDFLQAALGKEFQGYGFA